MKQLDVAYGSLDMRNGQGLDLAEWQIKKLATQKPSEWFFDIIHTPNQTPKALVWLPIVESHIKKYSKLPSLYIHTHLNTNDRLLRARNMMFEKIHDKDITDIKHRTPK